MLRRGACFVATVRNCAQCWFLCGRRWPTRACPSCISPDWYLGPASATAITPLLFATGLAAIREDGEISSPYAWQNVMPGDFW